MHNEIENSALFEWLALRCQAGDEGAFEDLIAVVERPLLYYVMSLTGSQDARDVMQDVWIKVFRGMRKLRDPGALRPWLYSITHGIAIDHIRRDYSRNRTENTQLENFVEADEPSFAEEDADAVHQALSQLGVKQREALVLHFLQDLSLAEIAGIVGCSEGTVKSRIHYAKQAMKKILEGANHGTEK